MRKKIIYLLILITLSVSPIIVLAQFDVSKILQPAKGLPLAPEVLINLVINRLIWPLVVTAVIILFIIAGFSFLTAQGDPGKLEAARKFLIWGIIGVIIIIIAFSTIITIRWILGL